ncbi:GNAT family N-acetyltransferase [Thermodesulfobacteriota bacterium]
MTKKNSKKHQINYFFQKPGKIPPETLQEIYGLIAAGGKVGLSWVESNLKHAFLIGYAEDEGRVIGTMSLKVPLEKYVKEIEEKTHLNLHGFLERGYTSVKPEYRRWRVADQLDKGLVERAPGEKIYLTIHMENLAAIGLARGNKMKLAATFYNELTGHEVGLFTNQD